MTPPETETGEIKVKRGSATVSAHPVLFPWLPLGGAREGRHSHTRLGRQFLTCECLIQIPGPAKAEIPKTHLTFSISEEVKKNPDGCCFVLHLQSAESIKKKKCVQLVTLPSSSCAITHARVIARTDEG